MDLPCELWYEIALNLEFRDAINLVLACDFFRSVVDSQLLLKITAIDHNFMNTYTKICCIPYFHDLLKPVLDEEIRRISWE